MLDIKRKPSKRTYAAEARMKIKMRPTKRQKKNPNLSSSMAHETTILNEKFCDPPEQLELLAQTGENIIQKGKNTLASLCLYSIFKVSMDYRLSKTLKNCFKLGIDVNKEVFPGVTPLMMSIKTNDPEMVKTVVAEGANVNMKTIITDSPLHYAVDQMKEHAVEALLEVASKRIHINKLGSDGLAALHRAVRSHSNNLIQILVRYNADVNVKGESGATPLHIAASCCHCSNNRPTKHFG